MSPAIAEAVPRRVAAALWTTALSATPFVTACVVAATATAPLPRAAAGGACVALLSGLVVTGFVRRPSLAERLVAALLAAFALDALALGELLALDAPLRAATFLIALATTTCVVALALNLVRPAPTQRGAWRGELALHAVALVVACLACLSVGV